MRFSYIVAFLVALFLGTSAASATVSVAIDLSHQRMNVTSSAGSYSWPISTARAGYVTPMGVYHPQAMYRMTYSKIYGNAPMPHAIFFNGGYAIHGTYSTGALGTPASHGCVRLAPGNAAALFQMVKAEGATITISGAAPVSRVASNARGAKGGRQVAQSRSGKGVKYAAAHGGGARHAHATHGKGTKYAGAAKKHHVAATPQAPQAQPQPSALNMFGLF